MTQTRPELLRQYLETDAQLMPLREWDTIKEGKGGVPLKLGKTPTEKNWPDKKWNQGDMVVHMEMGGNVGFRCGNGWAVVDYDPRNDLDHDGRPARRESWMIWKFLADFKLRPGDYAVVETGGGGLHIYLRGVPSNYRGKEHLPDKYGKCIEFKTSPRRYVVAAGSVHPGQNGQPLEASHYLWGHQSCVLSKTCDAPDSLLEAFAYNRPAEHIAGIGDESFGRFSAEELARILKYIPIKDFGKNARTEDHDWLKWMFACHWFTGGAGREEWIEWAIADDDYFATADELRMRWDSCDQEASGVKSGLVFKMLKYYEAPEHAYPREKTSEVVEAPDVSELEFSQEPTSREAKTLREMNRKYALVMVGKRSLVMFDDFDRATGEMFPNFQEIKHRRAFYENAPMVYIRTGIDGKPKMVETNVFDYWMKHPERRTYHGITFAPNQPREISMPNGLHYNMWNSWPFNVEHGRGVGEWSEMKEIIKTNLCHGDENSFAYLMNWLAYSLQYPGGPQRVAVVFRGQRGIGKGILGNAWTKMFGKHSMTTYKSDQVFGRFNYRLADTMGLFLDEAFWGGDKAKLSAVKAIITEPKIPIEQKFMDDAETPNFLKIMMATNEEWAVPAAEDERRFVVLDCDNKYQSGHPIFGRALRQLYGTREAPHTHGLRAMFYDLMTMDLGNFDPERDRIKTDALGSQVKETFGDAGEWWLEILSAGRMPAMFDPDPEFRLSGPQSDWEHRPVAVPMAVLREDLYQYFGGRPQGDLAYSFKARYAKFIMRMMPKGTKSRIRMTLPSDEGFDDVRYGKGNTADCFVLPPLPECRKVLENMFGVKFDTLNVSLPLKDKLDDLV